ncbi:hypothetical protein WJX73_000080 [Symbiochloris irregularis]|uniref:Uncharacterized protein n=1 Tax=Symbiochloris irregularis TaxID=706552 RepID=A0AAW1NNB4_9CHLO
MGARQPIGRFATGLDCWVSWSSEGGIDRHHHGEPRPLKHTFTASWEAAKRWKKAFALCGVSISRTKASKALTATACTGGRS